MTKKSILIDSNLHERLKNYTSKQNLLLGRYIENCLEETLKLDELEIDPRWKELQSRSSKIMKKIITSGDSILESEEYKQYINDVENYYNENNII